jgi:hypothetical protein
VLVLLEVDRVTKRRDGGARGEPCETNAKGQGRGGGATAPPEELFPRTTKKSQVGKIDQRPISTVVTEANDATVTIWSARIPRPSPQETPAGTSDFGPSRPATAWSL